MTPTPPHYDPHPTKCDPDHSVEMPRPSAPESPRRPWWVRLLGFLVRLILRRKGQ